MKRKNLWTLAMIACSTVAVAQDSFAQGVRQQRVENRAERQENRAQRLNNRAQYYSQQSWSQLDPWIARNQVPALNRAERVANAAANATERALNTANAAAANNAARTNAAFGFSDPNAASSAWFYDYYTYRPTYYTPPAANATVYGSAARYYDLNNDGVYDSLSAYRDSDNNGAYDVYDRYDFAEFDKDKDKDNNGVADDFNDANRHTVSGKIEATKVAKVNGQENLVVRVADAKATNQMSIVDLGAAERWQGKPVQEGETITATGPVERVGDKQVLIAESVTIGSQKDVRVTRSAPALEGQVVDVTRTEVKGAEHTLAIIDNGSTRQIVDLGPTSNLKVKVEPQVKLSVRGVPVQVRDRSVLMAEQVTVDGQDIAIQRW